MPSYNPNKSCEEKGVGLDELLPSMEALEIVPLLSVSSQSARFFWQTSLSIDSKSRVRFEIELFNGKDGGVIFREMTSTLLFPFDLDGSEGGRGWFTSWKVSRENQEYYRFLQDVVMNYPELREISPDRSPGRGCKTLMPLGISPPVHSQLN